MIFCTVDTVSSVEISLYSESTPNHKSHLGSRVWYLQLVKHRGAMTRTKTLLKGMSKGYFQVAVVSDVLRKRGELAREHVCVIMRDIASNDDIASQPSFRQR